MNFCIFIIFIATPAGTQNPPETCGCGWKNTPAGLPAGRFLPIPRVCLRAGFRQTRTRIHGCHLKTTRICKFLKKIETIELGRSLSEPTPDATSGKMERLFSWIGSPAVSVSISRDSTGYGLRSRQLSPRLLERHQHATNCYPYCQTRYLIILKQSIHKFKCQTIDFSLL